MFKEGDKYIRFSTYGGITKGIVKSVTDVHVIDTVNKVTYVQQRIVNENGHVIETDGTDGSIYKVTREFTDEEALTLSDRITNWKNNSQKS